MGGIYRITVGSLPEYEDLVAEIYIDGKFIGLVSQESGEGDFKLELAAAELNASTVVDLAVFEKAVQEAKEKLWKLRREPSSG